NQIKSLEIFQLLGDNRNVARCIGELLQIAFACENWSLASQLFGAKLRVEEEAGTGKSEGEQSKSERVAAKLSAVLGREEFSTAVAGGRALTIAQIVALIAVS